MARNTIDLRAALVPLLAMALVAAFGILFHGAITEGSPPQLIPIFSPGCGRDHVTETHFPQHPADASREAAFFNFAAAAQLLFVVQVGVTIAGLVFIWRRTQGRWRAMIILGAIILSFLAGTAPNLDFSPITREFIKLLAVCNRVSDAFINQERCGAFATAILTCSLGVVLVPRGEKHVADLSQRFERLSWILWAGTALLVMSIVRLDALYNWSITAAPAPFQKGLTGVATGVLRMWGVYYSTLLCAIYLPAYFRLRAEAEKLADQHEVAERRLWLEQNGLALSVADVLRRLAAIAAPLLAGEANKAFSILLK